MREKRATTTVTTDTDGHERVVLKELSDGEWSENLRMSLKSLKNGVP